MIFDQIDEKKKRRKNWKRKMKRWSIKQSQNNRKSQFRSAVMTRRWFIAADIVLSIYRWNTILLMRKIIIVAKKQCEWKLRWWWMKRHKNVMMRENEITWWKKIKKNVKMNHVFVDDVELNSRNKKCVFLFINKIVEIATK